MSQVSRPMQIALAAAMVFALAWFVVLRPKSSSGGEAAPAAAPVQQTAPASDGGAAPGTAGLKGAIGAAHDGVATADADAQRAQQSSADAGGTPAAPAASAPARNGAATARPQSVPDATSHATRGGGTASHAARHRGAGGSKVGTVKAALRHHEAVAIAFVDPSTADGRAVAQEIRHVGTFGGKAVALAVPLSELSDYAFITNRVEVTVAPTVVIVDRRRQATTIVGFADRGEIEQRLADALAVKR